MLHAKRHLLHRSLNAQLNNDEGIASYLVSDAPCSLLEPVGSTEDTQGRTLCYLQSGVRQT